MWKKDASKNPLILHQGLFKNPRLTAGAGKNAWGKTPPYKNCRRDTAIGSMFI
jgi:hypothetical protein